MNTLAIKANRSLLRLLLCPWIPRPIKRVIVSQGRWERKAKIPISIPSVTPRSEPSAGSF